MSLYVEGLGLRGVEDKGMYKHVHSKHWWVSVD